MLIALDYDNTYTTDPKLWNRFVQDAVSSNHTVQIVTMRYPHETIINPPCKVIYTSRKAKIKTIQADIWIDDSPHWIYRDAEC